ncbi:MAG: hypothetical protein R6U99_00145 [Nioella sp.]
MEKRQIVGFDDLKEVWKKEGIRNGCREGSLFLKPDINESPEKHILWDLDDCIKQLGRYRRFNYNRVMGISKNAAMLLRFDASMETATYMIIIEKEK